MSACSRVRCPLFGIKRARAQLGCASPGHAAAVVDGERTFPRRGRVGTGLVVQEDVSPLSMSGARCPGPSPSRLSSYPASVNSSKTLSGTRHQFRRQHAGSHPWARTCAEERPGQHGLDADRLGQTRMGMRITSLGPMAHCLRARPLLLRHEGTRNPAPAWGALKEGPPRCRRWRATSVTSGMSSKLIAEGGGLPLGHVRTTF